MLIRKSYFGFNLKINVYDYSPIISIILTILPKNRQNYTKVTFQTTKYSRYIVWIIVNNYLPPRRSPGMGDIETGPVCLSVHPSRFVFALTWRFHVFPQNCRYISWGVLYSFWYWWDVVWIFEKCSTHYVFTWLWFHQIETNSHFMFYLTIAISNIFIKK